MKKSSTIIMSSLGHLLWPAVCPNCSRHTAESGSLCNDCWGGIASVCSADYCRRCGRDVSPYAIYDGSCPYCRDEQLYFDGIARGGIYAETLRKIILAFKNGQTELDSIVRWLADSVLQVSGFSDEVELFVPVPLHWCRRFIRGYNQSFLLAKGLKHPTAKISTDLVRIRYTRQQSEMPSAAARKKNVAGAFAVRYRHPYQNKKICLVDDIKTTSATLNECAKTLKQAGALKVFALVLAVAGQNTR